MKRNADGTWTVTEIEMDEIEDAVREAKAMYNPIKSCTYGDYECSFCLERERLSTRVIPHSENCFAERLLSALQEEREKKA